MWATEFSQQVKVPYQLVPCVSELFFKIAIDFKVPTKGHMYSLTYICPYTDCGPANLNIELSYSHKCTQTRKSPKMCKKSTSDFIAPSVRRTNEPGN